MKRFYTLLVALSIGYTVIHAQNETKSLTGTIIDNKKQEAIEDVSIRILSLPDSTFIGSTTTDTKGNFSVSNLKTGKYIAVISFLGYNAKKIPFYLTAMSPTFSAGKIGLSNNAILLKEAVVTGKAIQVVVKEDTIIYNAAAFKVAEGSMLEDLVKKLPGAVIDNSGNITINGKQVKKILVDGKEYFSDDPTVAIKNLPANMVDKLKTYDKQSDFTRLTGIDDGNEETVLDLQVKPGMKDGWVGQAKLGAGNKDRYEENLTANRFLDTSQFSAVGSANNANSQGFSEFGGGGRSFDMGAGQGINTTKTLGVNFAEDNNKLKLGGDARYGYTNRKGISEQNTTTTYGGNTITYNASDNSSVRKRNEFRGNFRFEWQLDSLTNLIFRPTLTWSRTNDQVEDVSRTYNTQYPYIEGSATERGVNYRDGRSKSSGNSVQTSGNIQFTRRLNNKGRNVSIFGSYRYNKQNTDVYSINNIDYFAQDSTSLQNRYAPTNNHGYNYEIGLSYSEPVFTKRFLQLRYSYNYQHNTLDKYTYESGDSTLYADYSNKAIESLGNGYYNNYSTHNIGLSLRTIRTKYQYNIGITLESQSSQTFTYYGLNKKTEPLKQHVLNYSPDFEYRYRFGPTKQMRITYRGQSSAPSITNLQAIIDNTDSLNIQYGNPNLKPSYTNSLMFMFNNFMQSTLSSMMAMLNFQNTINGTTTQTTYISKTGGTVSHLVNVNGNWSVNGHMMYNVSLTKDNALTMNTSTNASYNNQVGYTSVSDTISTNSYSEKFTLGQKSITSNLSLGQTLRFGYRNDWLDVNISGGLTYGKVHNNKQTTNSNNQETWDYTMGNDFSITFPWKVYLTSNLNYTIRNGYSGSSDKNECLWNAQLTKSFLKNNAGSLQFKINDILHQQKSITRTVTNQSVSDVRYNTLGSYYTLSFIWKFNTLGKNRNSRNPMMHMGGFGGPGGGFGGNPGGGGGFSGGGSGPM
jgi:hypothetical protein